MGESLTRDQVRNRYIQAMGSMLGPLYFELSNQVAWLHLKWQQYLALFAKDPGRVDLLNRAAPLFFWILQKTLLDDVLLHLARLTDPPRSAGRDTLTIRRLPGLVEDAGDKVVVQELLELTLERCQFAREWRNRRLAHIDLLTLRKQHPEPLPDASRRDVENALQATRNLLNWFEGHYRDGEVIYGVLREPGDADSLIYHLKRAMENAG